MTAGVGCLILEIRGKAPQWETGGQSYCPAKHAQPKPHESWDAKLSSILSSRLSCLPSFHKPFDQCLPTTGPILSSLILQSHSVIFEGSFCSYCCFCVLTFQWRKKLSFITQVWKCKCMHVLSGGSSSVFEVNFHIAFWQLFHLYFPLSGFTVNHRMWPVFVQGDTEAVAGLNEWPPAVATDSARPLNHTRSSPNVTLRCASKHKKCGWDRGGTVWPFFFLGFSLAWPRSMMACPATSAKSIIGGQAQGRSRDWRRSNGQIVRPVHNWHRVRKIHFLQKLRWDTRTHPHVLTQRLWTAPFGKSS